MIKEDPFPARWAIICLDLGVQLSLIDQSVWEIVILINMLSNKRFIKQCWWEAAKVESKWRNRHVTTMLSIHSNHVGSERILSTIVWMISSSRPSRSSILLQRSIVRWTPEAPPSSTGHISMEYFWIVTDIRRPRLLCTNRMAENERKESCCQGFRGVPKTI